MSSRPLGFTGATIDRADAMRSDPAAISAALASLSARVLRLEGLDPAISDTGELVWTSLAEVADDADLLFLGLADGKPRFAALPAAGARLDAMSRSAWTVLPLLSPADMALYGAARSLIDWHNRHRYCARCGGGTHISKGGWQRDCASCSASHFPRTDPVVIMLGEHGGMALLGRQHAWPEGRYSALAGFVEPGESFEEAVRRELFEEAGVRAGAVDYVASQPWPFPSSLMIACTAALDGNAITLDTQELEDAIWVSRADVRAALAGDPAAPFIAPPPFAIAHHLLVHWAGASDEA